MQKDAYYFPHDCNARHDMKIQCLRSKYGAAGYGMYWILVEKLREQSDYKLPLNGKYSADIYALELGCGAEEAQQFINDCVYEFGLFETDQERFWSVSLLRRMERMDDIREKRREAGAKGGSSKSQANAKQMLSTRVKKSKEEEKKEEHGEYVRLTKAEHQKLVQRYGAANTKKAIDKLNNSIGAKGYKYKSHYRALLNWVFEAIGAQEARGSPYGKCPNCGAKALKTNAGVMCTVCEFGR